MSIYYVYVDQNLFKNLSFVIACRIGKKGLELLALINTSSCVNVLINNRTAQIICKQKEIKPMPLARAKPTQDWEGKPLQAISYALYTRLSLGGHAKDLCPFAIASLGRHQVIIGLGWLKRHGAYLDTINNNVVFKADYCQHPGAGYVTAVIDIKAGYSPPPARKDSPRATTIDKDNLETNARGAASPPKAQKLKTAGFKTPGPVPPKAQESETIGSGNQGVIPPKVTFLPKAILRRPGPALGSKKTGASKKPLLIRQIGAVAYRYLLKQRENEGFAISFKEIQEAIEVRSVETAERGLERPGESIEDLKTAVPREYYDLIEVFSKKEADELPPNRKHDHKIKLEGEIKPGYCPFYRMSSKKFQTVKNYLQNNL